MFSARIENSKAICEILMCLSTGTRKDQQCHIEATPELLTFVVTGKAMSTQSIVNLRPELFESYIVEDSSAEDNEPSVKLSLNLITLLDCFQIFGSSSDSTIASITYSGEDAVFKLHLEEAGVLTTCELTTLYDDDSLEVDSALFTSFRNCAEQCQLVVKSEHLREAIHELNDVVGASSVCVEVNASFGMTLSAVGNLGACDVSFPKDSEAFVSFRCERGSGSSSSSSSSSYSAAGGSKWMYPLSSLLLGMKALGVAKETYIRVNSEGMMCIQHQVENSKSETYIDFLMLAMESFDGDDGVGGGGGGGGGFVQCSNAFQVRGRGFRALLQLGQVQPFERVHVRCQRRARRQQCQSHIQRPELQVHVGQRVHHVRVIWA